MKRRICTEQSQCRMLIYGDSSSSLVSLYQFTGKPLMMKDGSAFKSWHFCTRWQFNNFMMMASITGSLDCSLMVCLKWTSKHGKRNTSARSRMQESKGSAIYLNSLYRSMAHLDGKMYFAPGIADAIAIYDTKADTFSQIAIEKPKESNGTVYL